MAFELTNLQLTLEQSEEQQRLGVVHLSYAYTLVNAGNAASKDPGQSFAAEIDILGDDVITDDLQALAVDLHTVDCAAGDETRVERSLMVAQAVLDEDIGDDEIKLRIRVSRDTEATVQAITPIVKGKF